VSTTSIGSSSPRRGGPPASRGVPHSPEDVQHTLQRIGVAPSRRSGQSFLLDPFVADAEAALTEAKRTDPVLEIGGGLGQLTEALLRRGLERLTVVERDPRLAAFLGETFGERIRLFTGDALEL